MRHVHWWGSLVFLSLCCIGLIDVHAAPTAIQPADQFDITLDEVWTKTKATDGTPGYIISKVSASAAIDRKHCCKDCVCADDCECEYAGDCVVRHYGQGNLPVVVNRCWDDGVAHDGPGMCETREYFPPGVKKRGNKYVVVNYRNDVVQTAETVLPDGGRIINSKDGMTEYRYADGRRVREKTRAVSPKGLPASLFKKASFIQSIDEVPVNEPAVQYRQPATMYGACGANGSCGAGCAASTYQQPVMMAAAGCSGAGAGGCAGASGDGGPIRRILGGIFGGARRAARHASAGGCSGAAGCAG